MTRDYNEDLDNLLKKHETAENKWRCPKCRSFELEVVVSVWAKLIQEPDGNFQTDTLANNHEFTGMSVMRCVDCSHMAPSVYFEDKHFYI